MPRVVVDQDGAGGISSGFDDGFYDPSGWEASTEQPRRLSELPEANPPLGQTNLPRWKQVLAFGARAGAWVLKWNIDHQPTTEK
jgi:hypothetical protein